MPQHPHLHPYPVNHVKHLCILIVLLTLNDRPLFHKRASGQVTELSLTADRLGRTLFGRTHRPTSVVPTRHRLGSAQSARLVTTLSASLSILLM